MAQQDIDYGTWTEFVCAIHSGPLASTAGLLAGRASTAVLNTTELAVDYRISGRITTGTSPTAGTVIEVWAYADIDTTVYPDGITGTDANKTLSSLDFKNQSLKLLARMVVESTSDKTYDFFVRSLADLYGGVCPAKFGVFVVHDTVVALNSTDANQKLMYQAIHYTI